ncbi:hypothetical protein GCM10010492_23050 [Saccharothrix mutabilis subsp. mutabilis]|uniref:Uncharacterized protein n=1 Tax=Saccharothrix mutabilis subsp. mutabilis TaxID=66855 RepID=A0ABN0TKZ2_9PSEU
MTANRRWPIRSAIGVTTNPLTRKKNGTPICPMPCTPMCMASLLTESTASITGVGPTSRLATHCSAMWL